MKTSMKPLKALGIISGAGPMAGVSFLKQLIAGYQAKGAWRDADFPYIALINYPFSDMLSENFRSDIVQKELLNCIDELDSKCDYIVITCQTIHLFLPNNYQNPKLVDIFSIINKALPLGELYVAASNTSANKELHKKWLKRDCHYISPKLTQMTIDTILKGKAVDMLWLERIAQNKTVLLGCTELSIPVENTKTACIDPYPYIIHEVMKLLEK